MTMVISEEAELAINDLRLLGAEQRRTQFRPDELQPGRIPGFGPSSKERLAQLTLTTAVSIAEHFSADRLLSRSGVPDSSSGSWPKQEDAWKKHWSVDLTSLSPYSAFRGFNEARNAIMHGRGSLTKMQQRSDRINGVRSRLTAANLTVRLGVVVISISDFYRCVDCCVAFVTALDVAAPA